MFQKIWGVIFFLAFSPAAWTYDFEADGIYYNITSRGDKTVKVTYDSHYRANYSGNVTIPATVTNKDIEYRVIAIGSSAFSDCNGLTSVTIPASVTSIGSSAFASSDLTSVTIPESVTTIGKKAFSGCTSLTSITIPESVTTIGEEAFSNCDGLTEFKGKFAVDNCCLIVNDTLKAFAPKCEVTEYVIPNGVRAIGKEAFSDCKGLTSVTIPESVQTIGDEAFQYCYGLTSVTIGEGVTTIGNYAFRSCTGLTSITIPESVTSIGSSAFFCCTGLTEFKGKFAVDDHCSLIVNDTLFIAFAPKCEVTEYVIPESVTSIGSSAFFRCYDLTSVTIPNSVTTIGDYAFEQCSGLTLVTIPDGVTTIGERAFSGCTSLTSVTIPESITFIYKYTFQSCTGLTSVTIPDGVTYIGGHAFENCTNLTSVTIPESVTTIGDYTFRSCTGLTSVTVYNPTPPDLSVITFSETDCANCTLYVPAESVELYKADPYWGRFGTILPIDESSAITEIQQDNADGHVTVYNLQGVLVLETDDAADLKTLQNGAYIVNGKTMIIAR